MCVCVCVCVCADPDERAQDMIQDYQRECGNMRVKPVTKLLEQLEVHTYSVYKYSVCVRGLL